MSSQKRNTPSAEVPRTPPDHSSTAEPEQPDTHAGQPEHESTPGPVPPRTPFNFAAMLAAAPDYEYQLQNPEVCSPLFFAY